MAVNFNAWLGSPGSPSPLATTVAGQRAIFAWRRIADKPSSVVFRKPDNTNLAAQIVRIEYNDSSSPSESAAGAASKRKLVIFGIKDHPTLADSDIKVGYRFVRENQEYRVESVIFTIGEVQAIAERVS